jgi:hypothetical protein
MRALRAGVDLCSALGRERFQALRQEVGVALDVEQLAPAGGAADQGERAGRDAAAFGQQPDRRGVRLATFGGSATLTTR